MEIHELKMIPLFSELKEDELVDIAAIAMEQTFKKDTMILIEEEVGSTMFIILNGRIKISRISDEGREVILSILVDGDFFGEMAILDGQTRSANAVTLEETQMMVIRRDNFLQLLHIAIMGFSSFFNQIANNFRDHYQQLSDSL